MWYEILVKNEFTDYFMNKHVFSNDVNEEKMMDQMLKGYADIVAGVTLAWTYSEYQKNDSFIEQIEKMEANTHFAFEFCHSRLHLTQAKSLSDIWKSIPTRLGQSQYDFDPALLNAEQIAVLIMYPFWSRIGGSYEKEFTKDGNLQKYLFVLNSKCNYH